MAKLCEGKVYLVSAFVEGMGVALLGFRGEEGVLNADAEGHVIRPFCEDALRRAMWNGDVIYVDYLFVQIPLNRSGDIAWAERGSMDMRVGGCWMRARSIIYFDENLNTKEVVPIEQTIEKVDAARYHWKTGLAVPEKKLIVPGQ